MNNNQVSIDGINGTIQPDGFVKFGSDDRMNVLFYTKSVIDKQESLRRGKPWHKSETYVRIQHPGETDFTDRPVEENDPAIVRWPRHWAMYQQGKVAAPNGTPVDVLFPQNPEIGANLHALGVHTIEQLAGLTAHGEQKIGMGATQWKNAAVRFLDAAKGGVTLHQLQAEKDKLQDQMETQANQISMMQRQLEALLAEKQGIPSSMVPQTRATQAQAHFTALPDVDGPMTDFSEGEGVETDMMSALGAADDGAPLFVEAPEEAPAQMAETPKRRGRPPRTTN